MADMLLCSYPMAGSLIACECDEFYICALGVLFVVYVKCTDFFITRVFVLQAVVFLLRP
jgi:hypothetical protein